MRVLLPLHAVQGGIRRHASELALHLPDALAGTGELVVSGGERLDQTRRVRRLAFEQFVTPRAALACDLVHLPDFRVPFRLGGPVVVTIHDLFFVEHPEWYPPSVRVYKRSMLWRTLRRRPEILVCVSEYTRGRLLELAPETRDLDVRTIRPGVRVPNTPTEVGSTRLIDQEYFLTVSTIEHRKNLRTLHAAYSAARMEGLTLAWVVVGGPGYGGDAIVSTLSRDRAVTYLGSVPDGVLDELMRHAAFVATPSYAEGFGFPPLEAMARGTPTVTSKGSALDESVGDASLRVDPTDRDAWADALLRLQDDTSLRRQLRVRGLEHVTAFQWEATAAKYVKAYGAAVVT